MAAYPSYNILLRSLPEEESGVEDDFADSGAQHSRIYHSGYYRFSVYHQLSLSQFQSLRSTYQAGQRDNYTLTFYDESPIQTYTVKFTGAPQIIENIGGNRFLVEVPLRGTAD